MSTNNADSEMAEGSETEPILIPQPKSFTRQAGFFRAGLPVAYNLPADDELNDETLRLALGRAFPLTAAPQSVPPSAGIALLGDDAALANRGREAYILEVGAKRIAIRAKGGAGWLMGLRTLAQLAKAGAIPRCRITDWPDFAVRGAHVCYAQIRETLANNAPNFDALLRHIDLLADAKINCVLLEIDAMFPFRKHSTVSCKLAFTAEQIDILRRRLDAQHMEIVPLVQSLGHAYPVLFHERYAEYRETPDAFQQFCPTNPAVVDLYMELVEEIMALFPSVRRWHIGGDECRQFGQCPRCKAKMEAQGVWRLYADHVSEVARRIHERGLTPLVWSDMWAEHHDDSVSLPPYVQIVYWNYKDTVAWPRPYVVPAIREAGYEVIGAPAVRSMAEGTELTVYYPTALHNIEEMIPQFHRDNVTQAITTNWTKGSPHESTEYGLLYAAEKSWNTAATRASFQMRFAGLYFGLPDRSVCEVYEHLSVWLPYAEPVQAHMVDRLNRYDLSGLRFPEKWTKYTAPENEPQIVEQLKAAAAAAERAQSLLDQCRPSCTRHRRHFEILALSARCIIAKARFGLALHDGRRLEQDGADTEGVLRWCAKLPAILGDWRWCKEQHRKALGESGFPPAIEFLSELMFEPAEYEFLTAMGARLAHTISADKKPEEVAVPFFYNPGPPYERGFRHGSVFKDEIARAIAQWCGGMASAGEIHRAIQVRMYDYVAGRWPEMIQEIRGIADGAGRSFDEIFRFNLFNAIVCFNPQGCSTVMIRESEGGVRMSKTSDIDPRQRKYSLLRRVRYGERDFYVFGWVGTLWVEVAMTSSGLAVGADSGPPSPDQNGLGIPQHCGLYPVLLGADNVKQALKALAGIRFAGKGLVIGLADAEGRGAIVEKNGAGQDMRRMTGPSLIGFNHFTTPGMARFNAMRGFVYLQNSTARERRVGEWLKTVGNAPATESLKDLIGDAQSEGALCQTGQAGMTTEAALILSPASKSFLCTGLPPSQRQYVRYDFFNI